MVTLAGCGSAEPSTSPQALTVFAAASLSDVFTTLGTSFEKEHPGSTVRFSFGPSSGLATQIVNGAPADVFASAAPKNLQQVIDAGAAEPGTVFARNAMEIAVPQGNPARIATLDDLAAPGVKVAFCAPTVPCGATARTVLANAGIDLTPVTEEVDVRSTLAKVRLGEVDAGIVYVTDVLAAGDQVEGLEIPDDVNAATDYPIATLTAAPQPQLAQEFVDHVLSATGSEALRAAGFARP